jgi:selenocysteine lyase/cysteine desulfurase
MTGAFAALERSVRAALEVYSNVHRGSGHKSQASTHLYERARAVVLEHLGLPPRDWTLVFTNRRRGEALKAHLDPGDWQGISSAELGLALGVHALAVRRGRLPRAGGFEGGGGTARLVGPGWVVWTRGAGRFEPGTPGIVNVVAFARALQLVREHGADAFTPGPGDAEQASDILLRDGLEALSGVPLLAALRSSVIGRGLAVPTRVGARPFVDLDNGASTPALEEVWAAAHRTLRQTGETQAEIVRMAGSVVADFLGAPAEAYDVVFTSNTTEAVHLAAQSLAASGPGGTVLNTLLEHNSNDLPWRDLPGWSLVRLDVDDGGFLDLETLEAALDAPRETPIRLVAISGASNVLGSFNDLAAICAVAHARGAQVLVDGAQVIAHRACDLAAWGVDWLAFSGHKAYAPFGTGVLVARKGLLRTSADDRASGEENAAGIAATTKALVLLRRTGMDVLEAEERALTARLLSGLQEIPKLRLFGVTDPASPDFARKGGVVAFEVKGMVPFRTGRELADRRGVGVRVGCHCAHLLVKRLLRVPRWAEQLQRGMVTVIPSLSLPGLVRVSLGIENDAADVDAFLETLTDIAARRPLPKAKMKKMKKDFVDRAAARVYGT